LLEPAFLGQPLPPSCPCLARRAAQAQHTLSSCIAARREARSSHAEALQLPRLAPLLCVRPSARACSSSRLSLSSSSPPPRSASSTLHRLIISTPRRTPMHAARAARTTTTTASAAGDAYRARLDAEWSGRLDELRCYAATHGGSTDVPTKSNDPALKKLGIWVRTQRSMHNNGELLRQDRVDALNGIGFDWDPLGSQWLRMFARLANYSAAHDGGSAEVARNDDEGLAQWLTENRRYMRNGTLTPERMAALQALGVTPDKMAAAHARSRVQSNEAAWRANFELLRAFVSAHGHADADVPFAHVQDGKKLGNWASRCTCDCVGWTDALLRDCTKCIITAPFCPVRGQPHFTAKQSMNYNEQ
jgi:hypothetical protein